MNLLQKIQGKAGKDVAFNFLVSEAPAELAWDKLRIQLIGILPRYYDEISTSVERDENNRLVKIRVHCTKPTSRFKKEGEWKIFYDLYNIYVPVAFKHLESFGIKCVCSIEHEKLA